MNTPRFSRRSFLKTTAAGSAGLAFPHLLRSQHGGSPNSKLNIACVGVGGRGRAAVTALKDENLVAFCDVDDARAAETYEEFPAVPQFHDYRRMLDRLGNTIDAVTVSTTDHMHFPIAMAALALGKHVFVEKPLTHTVAEARKLAAAAREKRVATQMGNQGHASESTRLLKEWVQAGILGEIREIHSWTNRPIWPQGRDAPDHSKLIPVAPKTLAWDLWLGVAQPRPYDPAYCPFNWRGYWDFGTGALGDMGCHLMDGGFWALDLDAPISVEAISAKHTEVSAPTASVVTYEFAARGTRPPVKWVWYDGGMRPPVPSWFDADRKVPDNSTFIIGSNATVLADATYQSIRIVPETRLRELAPSLPDRILPRVPDGDHFREWVDACKDGRPAGSNFDYAARLTELVLLSNVAIRSQRRIEWDARAMRVTNFPAANQYLDKEYRNGFGV
jgi:predicted dehydrogenase